MRLYGYLRSLWEDDDEDDTSTVGTTPALSDELLGVYRNLVRDAAVLDAWSETSHGVLPGHLHPMVDDIVRVRREQLDRDWTDAGDRYGWR